MIDRACISLGENCNINCKYCHFHKRLSKEKQEFSESEMTLFDFLYRWLPGMTGDGVLAGPNWNGDLVGREIDPYELRTQIESEMSKQMLSSYEEQYKELTESD